MIDFNLKKVRSLLAKLLCFFNLIINRKILHTSSRALRYSAAIFANIYGTGFLQQGIHVDISFSLFYQICDFQTTFFPHISISGIEFPFKTFLDSTGLVFIRPTYSFDLTKQKNFVNLIEIGFYSNYKNLQ